MKIQFPYASLINKYIYSEVEKTPGGKGEESSDKATGERKEISRLISAISRELKEIDRQEQEQRAARLSALQKKVEEGAYKVDAGELARAMLRNRD